MSARHKLAALLTALSLLSGCAPAAVDAPPALRVLAATYPVYLFTTAVTQDVPGVEVELLVNAQSSCLHDYTLTVKDMKAIESADVIILSGVGLEDFMSGALAHSTAAVIDCSQGIELLPTPEHAGHDGHDHDEEYDPHIWMDPQRAAGMMENIARGLERHLSSGGAFQSNCRAATEKLRYALGSWDAKAKQPELPGLITFHDGFQYFAAAYGLELLRSIEEEDGATASAREIREISLLIEAEGIPAIFTETNGPQATARAIARETGVEVRSLDMLMSGSGSGIQPYIDAISSNINTVMEALS